MKLEKRIILIEDNSEHIADAKKQLEVPGIDVVFAETFREFQSKLDDKIEGILTDLYFPSGNDEIYKAHQSKVLEIIEDYISKHSSYNPNSPITLAIRQIGNLGLGENPKEIVDLLERLDEGKLKGMYEHIRAVLGIDQKTLEYQSLRDGIKEGTHLLPEGIFVYQQAKEKGIPCIVVTSAYHHGTEFQPFTSSVGQYFDQLKDGRKMWMEAYHRIIKMKGGNE